MDQATAPAALARRQDSITVTEFCPVGRAVVILTKGGISPPLIQLIAEAIGEQVEIERLTENPPEHFDA